MVHDILLSILVGDTAVSEGTGRGGVFIELSTEFLFFCASNNSLILMQPCGGPEGGGRGWWGIDCCIV